MMIRKFEFTSEQKVITHTTSVRRIRALIDIPGIGVKVGDLGGFIMSNENLSHEGDCWVFDDAVVHGLFTRITGNARIYGHAVVESGSMIANGVVVADHAHVIQGDIQGESIFIRGEVVLESSIIKGTSVVLEGKAKISNIKLKDTVKQIHIGEQAIVKNDKKHTLNIWGSFLTISGNAQLLDVYSISGRSILIDQDAIVKNGVMITGTNVSLVGASCLDGKIDIAHNVEITECVSIFHTSNEHTHIENVILKGDFHKPASDFHWKVLGNL
jgi:hypothetical protein